MWRRRIIDSIIDLVPRGHPLPEDVWRARHRGIVALLSLHIPIVLALALVSGESMWHSLSEAGIIGVIVLAASLKRPSRTATVTITSFGLVTSSAILTHLSGGYIEFHFHFFIMLAVIALYQEWFPFLLSILYVAVQHGLVGVIDPGSVYNHPDAIAHPWKWAAIHAMFVALACGVYLLTWRWNEAARDHAKLVLNSAGEGIIGLSPIGNVLFINPAAERITGYRADEFLGRTIGEVLDPAGDVDQQNALERVMCLPEGQAVDGVVSHKDGTTIPAEFIRSSIRDRMKLTGSVITFRDTSERLKAQETIRYLAYHDQVTGLPNRALFHDRFVTALASVRRNRQGLAVVSLDVDHFKQVNDSLGHSAGDSVLRAIAKRLKGVIRESDTVARVGGDEFALLLPGTGTPEDADRVAHKLLQSIRRPLQIDGHDLRVTASIGISLHPDDGTDAESLLKLADAAMYHAKNRGRNGYNLHAFAGPTVGAHAPVLTGIQRPDMLPESPSS